MTTREFDVVVFGATGFTGGYVARYLAARAPEPGQPALRWALAGRSRDKVAAVARDLGKPDLPVLVADSHDRASLDAMAARTAVVCTTVGPYLKYGAPLVAACVEHGTHYVDLTGEVPFVRQMIDEHHAAARERGARIVHSCGFDSVPSDLGVFNLQEAAIERFGAPFDIIDTVVWGARGGVSGGTASSMVEILERVGDPDVRRSLADPYSLVPERAGERRGSGDRFAPAYVPAARTWTAPFFMGPVNARVVRRSNALLDHRWGRDLEYREVIKMGPGLRGRMRAFAVTAAMGAGMAALTVPPLRALAKRTVLPSPGQGPDEEAVESGYFRYRMFGRNRGDAGDKTLVMRVDGRRDPGYGATSCMLAESAVCLARHPDLPLAGVLTPASAMGEVLTERLNATDVQFALEET